MSTPAMYERKLAEIEQLQARLAEAERILRLFREDKTADAWPAMQAFLGTADSATHRESEA